MNRSSAIHLIRSCALAVAASLAVVTVGCGQDETSTNGANGESSGEAVVLVTYDSFVLPEEAAAAFAEQTGATIEVLASGDSGEMLTGALLSAGAPEGDVIFGIDDGSVAQATSGDLLEPVDGEQLVPIDRGDVCINVDEEWFAAAGLEPPSGVEQLTDPEYRDLLVVPSPVTSSPGFAFLTGTVDRFGEDGWVDYWRALEANGVRVRPSWDDAYSTDYTASGGDRPLVVSYASSPPAEVIFSDGARTEPASSVMVDSCVAQTEFAGVLRGAEHPELARELLAFMQSAEYQQALPLVNFVYPVRDDVELPEEFDRWAPRIADPIVVDPDVIAERRDDWIETWRDELE